MAELENQNTDAKEPSAEEVAKQQANEKKAKRNLRIYNGFLVTLGLAIFYFAGALIYGRKPNKIIDNEKVVPLANEKDAPHALDDGWKWEERDADGKYKIPYKTDSIVEGGKIIDPDYQITSVQSFKDSGNESILERAIKEFEKTANVRFVRVDSNDRRTHIKFLTAKIEKNIPDGKKTHGLNLSSLSWLFRNNHIVVSSSEQNEHILYENLLHEIGHAIGLKHPFDKSDNSKNNHVLSAELDNGANTVMSYTGYSLEELGRFDIFALQRKYGPNPDYLLKEGAVDAQGNPRPMYFTTNPDGTKTLHSTVSEYNYGDNISFAGNARLKFGGVEYFLTEEHGIRDVEAVQGVINGDGQNNRLIISSAQKYPDSINSIRAGAGDDTIGINSPAGGFLYGDEGNDTFVLFPNSNPGVDSSIYINDYTPGQDRIQMAAVDGNIIMSAYTNASLFLDFHPNLNALANGRPVSSVTLERHVAIRPEDLTFVNGNNQPMTLHQIPATDSSVTSENPGTVVYVLYSAQPSTKPAIQKN